MNTATKKLKITQIKSGIGRLKKQKSTLKALGITKRGRFTLQSDTPSVRSMIASVKHLVNVAEESGE